MGYRLEGGGDWNEDTFAFQFPRQQKIRSKKVVPNELGEFSEEISDTHTLEKYRATKYPRLSMLMDHCRPEESHLISQFINGQGPRSVYHTVNKRYDLAQVKNELISAKRGEFLKEASGIVFERLVHQWLKNKMPPNTIHLDAASCNRIFTTLRVESIARFRPDGADLVIGARNIPLIDRLYEYKLNPNVGNPKDQLIKMTEFMGENKGRTLHLSKPVDLEYTRKITSQKISITNRPKVTLVIPPDSNFNSAGVHTKYTPFSYQLTVNVARLALEDVLFQPHTS